MLPGVGNDLPSGLTRAMAIRGILFDKDGTLTDFHATWMPAYRRAAAVVAKWSGREDLAERLLAAGGYESSTGRCAAASALACGTNREIAELWSSVAGIDAQRISVALAELFNQHAAARAVPSTDLLALFERLSRRRLVLGVATMDSEQLAHVTLETLGLTRYMHFVCGYDSGHGEKPGPGMVRAFCAAAGLGPPEVAVVGDTPHDLNMARAAGAGLVVGVLTGASPRDSLVTLADHVLGNVGEVESVLD